MRTFQFVTKSTKKINTFLSKKINIYVASLLISTGRKNCSAMANDLNISRTSLYQYFDEYESQKTYIQSFLTETIRNYSTKENPGVLVADGSQLIKRHSKKLPQICYDYNSSMKLVLRGLTHITIAWTNGKMLIPLDFDFWIRKKDLEDDLKYKKKTDIAKELIYKWKGKIPFEYIALDGDYGNESFLNFLHQNKLKYVIRIPKNRRVLINGVSSQLRNHSAFKLIKNERYKTAKGFYKGIPAFFTCQKRKGKNRTKQIVFVISNLENLTPKQYILAYDSRWPIEKLFRTAKQHLGIHHCQCVSQKKQRAHFFAVFLAFTKLEIQKIDKQKKSPEEILKIIKAKNRPKNNPNFTDLEGLIM